MNKKIIIFALVVFFLLGLFFYNNLQHKKQEWGKWQEINLVNYETSYVLDGRKVTNESSGLSFLAPELWDIEIIEDYGVQISSPDAEIGTNFPLAGCVFGVNIEHYTKEFPGQERRPELIIKEINEGNMEGITSIDNYPALKTIYSYDSGDIILIEISKEDKIYSFGALIIFSEKERCIDEFDLFLKTVSIN